MSMARHERACLIVPAAGESNGAPGRGRTCDPRLRRPDVVNGYINAVIGSSSLLPTTTVQCRENATVCPFRREI